MHYQQVTQLLIICMHASNYACSNRHKHDTGSLNCSPPPQKRKKKFFFSVAFAPPFKIFLNEALPTPVPPISCSHSRSPYFMSPLLFSLFHVPTPGPLFHVPTPIPPIYYTTHISPRILKIFSGANNSPYMLLFKCHSILSLVVYCRAHAVVYTHIREYFVEGAPPL